MKHTKQFSITYTDSINTQTDTNELITCLVKTTIEVEDNKWEKMENEYQQFINYFRTILYGSHGNRFNYVLVDNYLNKDNDTHYVVVNEGSEHEQFLGINDGTNKLRKATKLSNSIDMYTVEGDNIVYIPYRWGKDQYLTFAKLLLDGFRNGLRNVVYVEVSGKDFTLST